MIFKNREHAGKVLAEKLSEYAGQKDLVVLGLPRGGVPVAYEVAQSLKVPLDVFVVRKLGLPDQPELAMGAIASGGLTNLNEQLIERSKVPRDVVTKIIKTEAAELERQEKAYLPRNISHLKWKNVILVDDGLATGSTMGAAVGALRSAGCTRLVIAIPVSSPETCAAFKYNVDKIVCAQTPHNFGSVGEWYEDFTQTTDEQVRHFLELSRSAFVDEVA
jgi:putative phosphoribosyl transferase